MSIALTIALISLLFKLFVLTHVIKGGKVSLLFLSLIVVFATHNAIEALTHIQYSENHTWAAILTFKLYCVATIYLMLYILLHGLSTSKLENSYTTASLTLIASVLSALILFTNNIVTGQFTITYPITATKAPSYWLFSTFIISILSISLFSLIYGYRSAKSRLDATRCKYSLFALTPILIIFSLTITLKIIDAKINAAWLVPIATTLFLIIILKTESKHKLSDIRHLLPLSLERQTANNFLLLLDHYVKNNGKDNAYKELQHGIEREIISYSLKKCNNNVAHTANMMGIRNRSTLYAMINRLEIDVRNINKQDFN